MFIKRALEALHAYDEQTYATLKEELTTEEGVRLKTNLSSKFFSYYNTLALGLITTMLHDNNINFTCYVRELPRSCWSKDSLVVPPKETRQNWLQERGFTSLTEYIHYKLCGTIPRNFRTPEKGYNIAIVQCSQGHTNVQTFLKHFGYTITETNIDTPFDMKVITCVIENTVYFLINNIPDINTGRTVFRRITGWLPVILKDAFKETLKDNQTLYDFFKNCYDALEPIKQTDLEPLKALPKIKGLALLVKTKTITNNIEKMERKIRENNTYIIETHKTTIRNLEEEFTRALQALATEELRQATSNYIKDKDLILQQCIKNPYVSNVDFLNNCIVLTTYGPVDYDKEKIKRTIKHYNTEFIKVMTNPDLELYWESCCTMNIRQFTVSNGSDYYHSNDKLPNAHWYYYNCFGDNKPNIMKALKENDYLSAIMIAITAAQCLNIYDITVLSKLHSKLTEYYPYTPTFYNKTTETFMSYSEAIKL